MSFVIDVNVNLPGILPFLQLFKDQLMASEAEIIASLQDATAQLTATTEQLAKVGVETATTLQKVTDLETVIASLQASGAGVSPALVAAVDALKAQVLATQAATTAVDVLVADAPVA
jgi:predicted  nucleic acid-binding Zn-ribbon protein